MKTLSRLEMLLAKTGSINNLSKTDIDKLNKDDVFNVISN
jgi:rRNA maturation endonuclease Nob1